MSARVLNAARLNRRLRRLGRAQETAVADAVQAGAREVREAARSLLSRAADAPSAPGEAPHRASGQLAASLFVAAREDGLSAAVGTDLDHGAHLEFGTRSMAARPWLQPTFARLKPGIARRIAMAARTALRGESGR